MNTTNTHIADAMESNGEVFLLDTSPSSGEPAEQSPFALRIFALAMTAAQDELEIDIVGDRHDASSPVVAKAKASRAALFAALSSAPAAAEPVAQNIDDAIEAMRVIIPLDAWDKMDYRHLRKLYAAAHSAQVQPSAVQAEQDALRSVVQKLVAAADASTGMTSFCLMVDDFIEEARAALKKGGPQ